MGREEVCERSKGVVVAQNVKSVQDDGAEGRVARIRGRIRQVSDSVYAVCYTNDTPC